MELKLNSYAKLIREIKKRKHSKTENTNAKQI